MKRYTVILCLMLCLCSIFSVCAMAEESVAVIYGADFNYTVNIPASIAGSGADNQHYAELSVSNALLPSNTEMTIKVTSQNYQNGWKMKNASSSASYAVVVENDEGQFRAIQNNDIILQFQAGEAALHPVSRALCFTFQKTIAGTYNDILTFVIEYVNS